MSSYTNGNHLKPLSSLLNAAVLPAEIPIPTFIAEIGCNHRGEVHTAKQMIVIAKSCGADVVKFQKRTPRELLTAEQYDLLYDNRHSYGRTYGQHREFLEFDLDTHRMLQQYATEHDVIYSSSVWDLTSAREIASLRPPFIKVPSACNNHLEMLTFLRDDYDGQVHISSGMSTEEEVERAVDIFARCPERVVLYHCVSGYPIEFEQVCLLELLRLKRKYQDTGRVQAIGFSGHHNGIAIDLLAPLLGAAYIERHFTLDRAWKGSDHAASLEPGGLRRLVRDVTHASQAWQFKAEEMLPVEMPQRDKLKYRLPENG